MYKEMFDLTDDDTLPLLVPILARHFRLRPTQYWVRPAAAIPDAVI